MYSSASTDREMSTIPQRKHFGVSLERQVHCCTNQGAESQINRIFHKCFCTIKALNESFSSLSNCIYFETLLSTSNFFIQAQTDARFGFKAWQLLRFPKAL